MDDKPRPKAPTLVGIGPPGVAVVVGAVGRLQLPSDHSVETQRMVFEPGHEPERAVEPNPSTAANANGEPLVSPPALTPSPPPPMAEPVAETPVLPPVAPVSAPLDLAPPATPTALPLTPAPRSRSPVRRSSRWLLAMMGGLLAVAAIAVVVSLRHAAKKHVVGGAPRAATPTATPTPTATTTTTTTTTTTPTPTATLPPTAWFNAYAARHSLDGTSREVAKCRRGKAFGIAVATVTFGNDGSVTEQVVSPPFAGTPTGACVGDALTQAHVAPFAGKPGVLVYRFYVAPN